MASLGREKLPIQTEKRGNLMTEVGRAWVFNLPVARTMVLIIGQEKLYLIRGVPLSVVKQDWLTLTPLSLFNQKFII